MKPRVPLFTGAACVLFFGCSNAQSQQPPSSGAQSGVAPGAASGTLLTGQAALGDWTTDAPGVRRRITPADLPQPYTTESARNFPRVVPRPEGAWPKAPAGFTVELFASGLRNPRKIITAPNGDLFVAESQTNRVSVLRDADGDGKPEVNQVFAEGLRQPFGIAFYPPGPNPTHVYVANTDSVVRFPYRNSDLTARGAQEAIALDIPGGGQLPGGGHWTRDVTFSKDGQKMFVSIGSQSNVDERNSPIERRRALIYQFTPEGKNQRIFAYGIRNPVGIAVHPVTGWWRYRKDREIVEKAARYSLIVSISTEDTSVDLYAAIENEITTRIATRTVTEIPST